MATFKTYFDMATEINKKIEIAVANACNRLLGTLQGIIDKSYYDQFVPDYYERSYQFWRSAITKMLSKNCGQVFMNESAMNYGTYWNGECQLQFANRGYHGTTEIQTEGRFFDEFIEFCENNAIKILREELIKAGIPLK